MNRFFEDLEDGLEPIETDDNSWLELNPAWEDLKQLVTSEASERKGERPDLDTLIEWLVEDADCETTDGCWRGADETCPHGH